MAGWAPDYADTSELASLVRVGDVIDDAQLALALSTASRSIDHACGRQFGLLGAVEARYYSARWDPPRCRWVVPIDDLMTATGLVVAVDTLDDLTYAGTVDNAYVQKGPINAAAKGRPWTELVVHRTSSVQPTWTENAVKVTARWGWSSVPTTIKQAALLQASRVLARRDSPFGVAGSPEIGSELRLLARLDPDVAVAVAPYRRWWGAF
jgi:hypothetical protein